VVDQVNGPITTIEEALEKAKPNTNIFLAEGIYTITVPITTPGLIFDRKDHEKKVYIVGNDGPVVNIVLGQGEFVLFKKIIFLHSGVNILHRFIENAANEPKYTQKPSKKCVAEFQINPHSDCIIFLHSGGAVLQSCTVNLKSLPKNMKSKVSAVIAMPRTLVNLNGCQFNGNETNHDAAVMAIHADLHISNCSFVHFGAGAIYTCAKPDNEVIIQDCTI
jgi:hypothetical protein